MQKERWVLLGPRNVNKPSVQAEQWDERAPNFGVLLQRSIALAAPPGLLSTSTAANSPRAVSVPAARAAGFKTVCGLRD